MCCFTSQVETEIEDNGGGFQDDAHLSQSLLRKIAAVCEACYGFTASWQWYSDDIDMICLRLSAEEIEEEFDPPNEAEN